MSAPGSVVDGETFRTNSAPPDKDGEAEESGDSSEDEDDTQDTVKKRFNDILKDLREDRLDLCNPDQLKQFAVHNANYLGGKITGDSDGNTLLHKLIVDAKDKVISKYEPLVKLLIERHPDLMTETAGDAEKTPLYTAISKKRDKLVLLMCEAHPDIDAILGIPCYHSENCLHIAIRRNIVPKTAIFLIQHASEATLCAKDDKGNTPLHLAVDYDRCIEAQLEVVQALISRCANAMDERTTKLNLSPYRYHEHTRAEAKMKEADEKKEREAAQGKKEEGSGDGPGGKEAPAAKFNLKDVVSKPKDVKASKSTTGSKGQMEPPRRVNTSSETPVGRHGNEMSPFGGPRNVVMGEPPKIGPNIGRGLNPKTAVAPEESKKRKKEKDREKEKPTEESADAIRDYLKLQCMRERNHDDAFDLLYGPNDGTSPPSPVF